MGDRKLIKTLSTQFKERLFAGSLTLTLVFISIFFSHQSLFKPIFIGLNTLLICFALIEYYRLVQQRGFEPLVYPALGCSIIYMLALALSFENSYLSTLPNLILLGSFIVLFSTFFRYFSPIGNLAVTIFGIIYLTIPLSCAMRINYFFPSNELTDGRLWLFYVLIVSKSTDVGGYFIGKWKGKTKLARITSPKKTLEGAIGGLCFAMIVSLLFASFYSNQTDLIKISLWQSLWLGLIISILAQLGDLTESLLKRDAGVKDSNRLPGLGGVLDTVDSLVFTLPFMYIFLEIQQSYSRFNLN